jgi:hypothetical protein
MHSTPDPEAVLTSPLHARWRIAIWRIGTCSGKGQEARPLSSCIRRNHQLSTYLQWPDMFCGSICAKGRGVVHTSYGVHAS